MILLHRTGLPHSEISGSKVACHLPEAYRRLLRPSSSCRVEASTIYPYSHLDHKNCAARSSAEPRASSWYHFLSKMLLLPHCMQLSTSWISIRRRIRVNGLGL